MATTINHDRYSNASDEHKEGNSKIRASSVKFLGFLNVQTGYKVIGALEVLATIF